MSMLVEKQPLMTYLHEKMDRSTGEKQRGIAGVVGVIESGKFDTSPTLLQEEVNRLKILMEQYKAELGYTVSADIKENPEIHNGIALALEAKIQEFRKLVWQKTMTLTIEMQYKKSQFLKGKYEAFKEIWDELGGDINPIVTKEE